MDYVIGVDVGGTNTDTAILRCGRVVAKGKKPTSEDKSQGVVSSIQAAIEQLFSNNTGESDKVEKTEFLNSLARVAIGTTHFVNAVKKRDSQSLDRVAVLRLCGSASRGLPPFSDFPEELKELVYGGGYMLKGGVEYDRKEIEKVDEEEVRQCVREIVKREPPVRHVVIAGVFSPSDDPCGKQERQVERIVKDECPQLSCTLSHELGRLGLLERENACVLNESLKSLAKVTVKSFEEALSNLNIRCPFYLTQNDGTMISAEEAVRFPVLTFSSGPTNSMRGAAFLSGQCDAIVVDIGGTTTDVGVLNKGFPRDASTHCTIGGVRTNFSMPDVHSIALGGGSRVKWSRDKNSATVGPDSVEYRISQEALCFGGETCTATDIAIAARVAPADFCTHPVGVAPLPASLVYTSMREIHRMIEDVIDTMKTEREDVPVILVGGGCILVDKKVPLKGASQVLIPEKHWDVANAVGAALGTVGGVSDIIVSLEPIKETLKETLKTASKTELDLRARQEATKLGREAAIQEVIGKIEKATGHVSEELRSSVYIHSEELSDIAYIAGRVRVKVKAIGALTTLDAQMAFPARSKEEAVVEEADVNNVPKEVAQQQSSKDNPDWPYSSAQDKMKDIAANLPPPELIPAADGRGCSEWVLSVHDVECLALGAGILGCGGGGDPNIGRLIVTKLLKEGRQVKIINPCKVDVSKMGVVCGIGFMGAPAVIVEKLVGGEETHLALTRLRQLLASGAAHEGGGRAGNDRVRVTERTCTYFDGSSFSSYMASEEDLKKIDFSSDELPLNRQITGLICLEAGGMNSMEPISLAAKAGLPVMDVDGMGRAFPELQMYVPFIYGSAHNPSVLAECGGESLTCSQVDTSVELEKFFRVETVRMGMSAGLAMGVMDYPTMMSKAVLYTMSRAWQLGRVVMRARHTHSPVLSAVTEQQDGLVIISGKVVGVARESEAGFTRVLCTIEGLEDFAGHKVRVQAKNENYVVHKLGMKEEELDLLACTPDLISIMDSNTGVPVTTEEVRYGLRVGVVVLPANPMLKTPEAMAVVGPRAFGFDMDYRKPHPLIMDT